MGWFSRCPSLPARPSTSTGGAPPSSGRLQTVPLARIAGTISRCCDFDRCFRVLRAHLQPRLDDARRRWRDGPFPPVRLVEDADGYWVVDGHHRLALAHERGMAAVDAIVTRA